MSYAVQSGNVSATRGSSSVGSTKTTAGNSDTFGNRNCTRSDRRERRQSDDYGRVEHVRHCGASTSITRPPSTRTRNGTVTLSQANNFSGNTALSGSGTLQLQNAGSIGSSALTLSGGTLQLRSDTANTTFTDASTTVSGSTTINVDQASSAAGLTLLLGNISTAGNTITVTNGNSYNLTVGTVSSSAG